MHSRRTNPKQYEPANVPFRNFSSPRQSIKFGWKEGREEGKVRKQERKKGRERKGGKEGGRKRKEGVRKGKKEKRREEGS